MTVTRKNGKKPLALVIAGAVLMALALCGCKSFKPAPESYQPHLARALSQTNGSLVVSAAALGRKEAEKMFGLPLHKKRIQPVWLRIENRGTNGYYFLIINLDRDYYSPAEVSYIFRKLLNPWRNRKVTEFIQSKQIELEVAAGRTHEGFVFSNYDPGAKHVLVELLGDKELRSFEFSVPVPGIRFDYERVDWENLYPEALVRDLTIEQLLQALAELPDATTDAKGQGRGDPINLVIIGNAEEVRMAFVRQGWDFSETLTPGTALRLVWSFLFNSYWETSPVSPLYLFGRRQDVALQKARHTIHERNHLRLWLAPYTCGSRLVWVGQISRDIGLRFTTRAPGWVTHKIDPDVDEARDYLVQDMVTSRSVSDVAAIRGFDAVPADRPRKNLTGDPYHSDGRRAVLFVSKTWVAPDEVEFLQWAPATNTASGATATP